MNEVVIPESGGEAVVLGPDSKGRIRIRLRSAVLDGMQLSVTLTDSEARDLAWLLEEAANSQRVDRRLSGAE